MNQYAVDRLVRDRIADLHRAAERQRVLADVRRARRTRRIRTGRITAIFDRMERDFSTALLADLRGR